jgi:rhodanese-related sulfurtransferase
MKPLAYLAAALGASAALAGSPYAAHHGRIDVEAMSRAVAREEDHVTAVELAEWIKERRSGLRVIDVRTREEYNSFHVPTAERIAVDSLAAADLRPSDVIVLFSEGGAHAAQAWVFLRALGYPHVYFLRGGLYEWLEQIMSPALAANATSKDSAEFARTSAISRYFGGVPRAGGAVPDDAMPVPGKGGASTSSTQAAVARIRRRGC